jgi:NAD(P)-dependent dehydrogenase (short-subunit alcohol dehydrogenase family)
MSYLAYELGPRGIRVHAISPGPLKARAAVRLKDFERLLSDAARRNGLPASSFAFDGGANPSLGLEACTAAGSVSRHYPAPVHCAREAKESTLHQREAQDNAKGP